MPPGPPRIFAYGTRKRGEAPEVFDTAVAILQDVAIYWSRRNVTFRAFVGVKSGKTMPNRSAH